MRGYRRLDGLYDIEARLRDTKARDLDLQSGRNVPAGQAIHDMALRLVVDEELNVVDIAASTDASPFGICSDAVAALQSIKGLRIGAGWSRAVRERLARRANCTHLVELLGPLATVAFQTIAPVRLARPAAVDGRGKPVKIDSCYAYASDREVVRERWPDHYDGPPSS